VSHGTHLNESWRTYERAITHTCVRALRQQDQKPKNTDLWQCIAAVWRLQMLSLLVKTDALSVGQEAYIDRALLSVCNASVCN